MDCYPLLLKPVYQRYLWGGDRIAAEFGREDAPTRCAESWEVADRPEGSSTIRNGALAGRLLHQLVETGPASILGARASRSTFPLLVKILDAHDRLSIQVHPDDGAAARYGGEAKTEMWYVLAATPAAGVYLGVRDGVTEPAFREAIDTGTVEDLMEFVPLTAGDVVFVPGGRMHAVGAGCLLLEVQQNSNTTYRVYDWGRVDSEGRSRELHIEQAMQVTRWHDTLPRIVAPLPLPGVGDAECVELLQTPYFRLSRFDLRREAVPLRRDTSVCDILFAESGDIELRGAGDPVRLARGATCLIPAACAPISAIALQAQARLLRIQPAGAETET